LDGLPGIDIEMINGLRKNAQDSDDTWDMLYGRAWNNLVADVSRNLQDKFFVDSKLVSRETSAFLGTYNSGVGGVKITFNLSKYTKLHIISVAVFSQIAYTGAVIRFYDTDSDGEVLLAKTVDLAAGRNTINVDADFEVDELFIGINASLYTVRKTENKFYQGMHYTDSLQSVFCFDVWGGTGSVEQVNGGGINAKYVVFCSIEKFVCENINLFKYALQWKCGVEIADERRIGEKLNRFTTMDVQRATELTEYFTKRYETEIMNVLKSQNIEEDAVCFTCKNTVHVQTALP
jgi:hypothetical protein